MADCLNRWLQTNIGTLPRALAVDGKWIRDRALSLCLSDHETGAPVAMGFAKEKTKNDDEQSKDDYKREGKQTVPSDSTRPPTWKMPPSPAMP